MMVPALVSHMVARCRPGDSRLRPKIHSPTKVDSRKKANRPSMARGAPKMLPTKIEYADQLRPNSNSRTIPVTTPTAMLIRKIRPKKRLSRSQVASLLR